MLANCQYHTELPPGVYERDTKLLSSSTKNEVWQIAKKIFNLWYYPMGIYVPVLLKTDSYSSEESNYICMHKAHYNAHTKPLFYASNVLNINFTYLLEVSKFMHDYTRRTLPTPLLNFFSSNLTVHQHNTRQVLDPHFFHYI